MNHYLNSFLIEPVVRQARRFSRPNIELNSDEEVEQTTNSQHGLASGTPNRYRGEAWEGEQVALDFPSQVASLPGNAPDDMDQGALADGVRRTRLGEAHRHQSEPSVTRLVETHNLEPAISARRYTLQDAEDAQVTPLYNAGFNGSLAEGMDQMSTIRGGHDRSRGGSHSDRPGEYILPVDDGMSNTRKRIQAIQRTDSSNEEKARLMHTLMTEKHHLLHSLYGSSIVRTNSPISMQSSDRPFTPSSPKSMESLRQTVSPPTSSGSNAEPSNPFNLSPEDLKPTYFERKSPFGKEMENGKGPSELEEETRGLGCAHYKRNIKLQCSACFRWYTCRFCHDAVEDHMLNRKETKNMLCMLCGCAQPASEECAMCSERAAWYYCDVCKLWDDDPQKSIYHCNDCGICRIGQGLGKDFFHCKTCCVCMSIKIQDTHRCVERSTDCDCPICGEYMFTSPQTVVFMRCGHSIHQRCYNEYMKSSYRCPICSRSIVNMEWQFTRLESAIQAQPMPEEFRNTKALIYCNDCNAKTSVRYHWLGLKCAVCDSYNTAQLRIHGGPDPGPGPASQPVPRVPPSPPASIDNVLPMRSNTHNNAVRPISNARSITDRQEEINRLRLTGSGPTNAVIDMTRPASSPSSPTVSAPSQSRPRVPSTRHQRTQSLATATGNPSTINWPLGLRSINDNNRNNNQPTSSHLPTADSSSDAEDSMDDDEDEYSEVEFWGGESPRLRALLHVRGDDEYVEDFEEDDEDEDEEEEEGEDGHGSSRAVLEGEDAEDEDPMEIFGHR